MSTARTVPGSFRRHAPARHSTIIVAGGRAPRITVVVHPDAVVRARGHAGYGSYSLYLAANVDPAVEAIVRKGMREALIAARFSNVGIDPQSAQSMLNIAKPDVSVVTRGGEQPPRTTSAMLLSLGCAVLLLLGVTMGGQLLLTSTVEEKGSRVVEVLLASGRFAGRAHGGDADRTDSHCHSP